ncbi:J domain-containing protein [Sulfurospirillum deleyianum]|uniref:Heat shock protein DnaJ domain protein n=1 Tax=Sulfurospirillum deleyianum (strain ATCC 51133 / DSM 6946 / 5175) TaxID=525898 RepID=D1B4I9_SULD5|nr:DnaJ domain-containing protein [Sulfurospirillum deleyianum]ACZ13009.1 heat shock protein DnaJ domain protein [Sulfurospirillum deleyianum DSM 6946]
MKLHLTSNCIVIKIAENSPFFLHVKTFLMQKLSRSFCINQTLINLYNPLESEKRKAFLTRVYTICAHISQTQNPSFLEKLLLSYDKPIKIVHQTSKPIKHVHTLRHFYTLLNAHHEETLHVIRKKYLHLIKQYHPDHLQNENETMRKRHLERFYQIQEAYTTIRAEKTKPLVA